MGNNGLAGLLARFVGGLFVFFAILATPAIARWFVESMSPIMAPPAETPPPAEEVAQEVVHKSRDLSGVIDAVVIVLLVLAAVLIFYVVRRAIAARRRKAGEISDQNRAFYSSKISPAIESMARLERAYDDLVLNPITILKYPTILDMHSQQAKAMQTAKDRIVDNLRPTLGRYESYSTSGKERIPEEEVEVILADINSTVAEFNSAVDRAKQIGTPITDPKVISRAEELLRIFTKEKNTPTARSEAGAELQKILHAAQEKYEAAHPNGTLWNSLERAISNSAPTLAITA